MKKRLLFYVLWGFGILLMVSNLVASPSSVHATAGNSRPQQSTPQLMFTEYPIPTQASSPEGVAPGPDGNIWFTEYLASQIGRITPNGTIAEFPIPGGDTGPWNITAGPDGNLWFTLASGNQIGRSTPAGSMTLYSLPNADSEPLYIT